MHMDIGNHGEPTLATAGPELREMTTVELNDAAVESVRVDVVVEYELRDPRRLTWMLGP
jgi:hypothetical protein